MTLEIPGEIPAAELHLELVVHGPGEGGVGKHLGHAPPAELGRHHSGGEVDGVRGEHVILEVGAVTISVQSEDLTILVMLNLTGLRRTQSFLESPTWTMQTDGRGRSQ